MNLHLMSTWGETYIQPAAGGRQKSQGAHAFLCPIARLPVLILARSQEQPRLSLLVTSVGGFEVARLRRID